jgi:hypothetical protein
LNEIRIGFGVLFFWRKFQRRGVHVNILEKGSRGAGKCSGGISRIYAELRRELLWGNLSWGFFGFLVGVPRRVTEEGGHLVFTLCFLREFNV